MDTHVYLLNTACVHDDSLLSIHLGACIFINRQYISMALVRGNVSLLWSMARRRSPAAWSDRAVHSATAWAVARFAAGVSSDAVALASFREQARTRST